MEMRSAKTVPVAVAVGGLALVLSGLAVLLALAKYWGANSEYADRFLIILGSGWLIGLSLSTLPHARPTWLGLPLIPLSLLLAPPAYYLLAQVGPRSILLWWMLFAWELGLVGWILLVGGWPWLRVLSFPLAFLFLALPIPERIEGPLQARLQTVTTTLAEQGLTLAGAKVTRRGFELHLPSGSLEVVEACSGVRSVTALLAIAAFVAHVRGFGLFRGLMLIGLALPVIALINALRVMITGGLQEGFGPEAITGTPHEILGILMVLVGLGMVLLLSQLLRPRAPETPAQAESTPIVWHKKNWNWVPAGLLAFGFASIAIAFVAGRDRVVQIEQSAPIDQLPTTIAGWSMTESTQPLADGESRAKAKEKEQRIFDEIAKLLTHDKAVTRVYETSIGRKVTVWVIFWQASTSIRGYHHPDICFPNRGYKTLHKSTQILKLSDGASIPMTIRQFEQDREKLWVGYWTQEGSRIWTEEDDLNADHSGPGHNWIRDRLVAMPPDHTARMTVQICTDNLDEEILKFARTLAEELYTICPWGRPKTDGK